MKTFWKGKAMSRRLACLLLFAANACLAEEIKVVIAQGAGNSPQAAAQDAAQNALTNVVGSFIDADKQLQKQAQIQDGVRKQTVQIRTDIKEYSQGMIRSFEIVDARQEGGLSRVTAKVAVRVEDFHVYIKKLAEGETSIGPGLFAEMATGEKQNDSLAAVLAERLTAVVNGEVIRFSVGKPIPFRRSTFAESALSPRQADLRRFLSRQNLDQLAVIEVTAALSEDFIGNFDTTLEAAAVGKKRISIAETTSLSSWRLYSQSGNCGFIFSEQSAGGVSRARASQGAGFPGVMEATRVFAPAKTAPGRAPQTAPSSMDSNFCLPVLDPNAATATVYSFSNVDRELAQHLGWTLGNGGSFDLAGDLIRGAVRLPQLEIAFLDTVGKELQVELVNGSGAGDAKVALDTRYPWLLYYPPSDSTAGAVLLRQRTFHIIMKIDDDALRHASGIHLRLVS